MRRIVLRRRLLWLRLALSAWTAIADLAQLLRSLNEDLIHLIFLSHSQANIQTKASNTVSNSHSSPRVRYKNALAKIYNHLNSARIDCRTIRRNVSNTCASSVPLSCQTGPVHHQGLYRQAGRDCSGEGSPVLWRVRDNKFWWYALCVVFECVGDARKSFEIWKLYGLCLGKPGLRGDAGHSYSRGKEHPEILYYALDCQTAHT